MDATRILYCGSDSYVRRFIQAALEITSPQLVVLQEADKQTATDLVSSSTWTLIVLDCRETDSDAAPHLIRTFREAAPLTALMVLARNGAAILEEVMALRAGADDWLVFPCPQEELAERCRALIRRVSRPATLEQVRDYGPFSLDESMRELTGPDGTVSLTCTETRLLACLLCQPDQCILSAGLLSAVWNTGTALGRDQVKVGVYRLRHKLSQAGIPASIVESHRGLGYRINLSRSRELSKRGDIASRTGQR
ncbi:MAG: response regulator transcription factor [Dehalococcoidia bacterium]|nr:response regulator transcription factor [Dehalococcoidia bacterium]